MADVFISYARQDRVWAEQLRSALEHHGLSVFVDHALVAGESFTSRVTSELADSNVVLVLLSGHSSRGQFVEDELRAALDTGRTVVPVLLDENATNNWVWPLISNRQSATLRTDDDFGRLIQTVIDLAARSAGGREEPLAPRVLATSGFHSRRGIMILVAIASAIVGGLITWLVM